jgi:hypothetical protein
MRGLSNHCDVLPRAILCLALVFSAWPVPNGASMDISQTISDEAQLKTIAFDGFAMITGNLEAQSFFPPGKVADYWGFQYLRDNTPEGNGHNTSFLTNLAFNVLSILTDEQFAILKSLAESQVSQINLYAYKRYPLMKAFRRQLTKDLPTGSTGLSLTAVKAASNELYRLDGQISFDRAVAYATVYRTLNADQIAYMEAMDAGGFASWTVPAAMETAVRNRMKGVSNDVSVALMTYAGDFYSWYVGNLDADVYFCPERQGTYFGSFYVKDAPAVGHEGYKIDEGLTAAAGQDFLNELASNHLDTLVSNLVGQQRNLLFAGAGNILQVREDISTLLRSLIYALVLTDELKSNVLNQVLEKSGIYGDLDGEIVYDYTIAFSQVYESMNSTQKIILAAKRKTLLSGTYNGTPFDYSVCTTPYLYSAAISDKTVLDPYISNTDYLFLLPGRSESSGTRTSSGSSSGSSGSVGTVSSASGAGGSGGGCFISTIQ